MTNRLFCTFSSGDFIDHTLDNIKHQYEVLYNKIFILFSEEEDLYLVTYNVDLSNLSTFPKDTILVHRKKESRTLYTINALNLLIQSLNGGRIDTQYKLNWQEYKDCILLTRGTEFKRMNTKLHRIEEL